MLSQWRSAKPGRQEVYREISLILLLISILFWPFYFLFESPEPNVHNSEFCQLFSFFFFFFFFFFWRGGGDLKIVWNGQREKYLTYRKMKYHIRSYSFIHSFIPSPCQLGHISNSVSLSVRQSWRKKNAKPDIYVPDRCKPTKWPIRQEKPQICRHPLSLIKTFLLRFMGTCS